MPRTNQNEHSTVGEIDISSSAVGYRDRKELSENYANFRLTPKPTNSCGLSL